MLSSLTSGQRPNLNIYKAWTLFVEDSQESKGKIKQVKDQIVVFNWMMDYITSQTPNQRSRKRKLN